MNRPRRETVFLALVVGVALALLTEISETTAAVAGIVAAVALGAAFPPAAFALGMILVAPQVPVAVVRGATESVGLAAVAVLAGAVGAAVNGLLAMGGALARRSLETIRSTAR